MRLVRESGLNPFKIEGIGIISKIHFYKDGEVIITNNRGWFGNNNNFKYLVLPCEIKRANKINLNRKDAFYIKDKDIYNVGEYILYLPYDDFNIQRDIKVKVGENETETTFIDYATIKLMGVNLVLEKDSLGRFIHVQNPNGLEEHEIKFSTTHYYYEDKPEKDYYTSMMENINNKTKLNLTLTDTVKLLNSFDVIEK